MKAQLLLAVMAITSLMTASRTQAAIIWFETFDLPAGIEIYTARGGKATTGLKWCPDNPHAGTGCLRLNWQRPESDGSIIQFTITLPRITASQVTFYLRNSTQAEGLQYRLVLLDAHRQSHVLPWRSIEADEGSWTQIETTLNASEQALPPLLLLTIQLRNYAGRQATGFTDLDELVLR